MTASVCRSSFRATVNWNITKNLNTVWGVGSSVDGTDKGKLATEEDAGFAEAETKKELDFTQPNFGLISRLPVRFQVQSVIHVGENNLNYLISKQDET